MAEEAITKALHRLDDALRRVERSVRALLAEKEADAAMVESLARMRAAMGRAVADIDALTTGDENADQGELHHG